MTSIPFSVSISGSNNDSNIVSNSGSATISDGLSASDNSNILAQISTSQLAVQESVATSKLAMQESVATSQAAVVSALSASWPTFTKDPMPQYIDISNTIGKQVLYSYVYNTYKYPTAAQYNKAYNDISNEILKPNDLDLQLIQSNAYFTARIFQQIHIV